jgi:hypothetical protein
MLILTWIRGQEDWSFDKNQLQDMNVLQPLHYVIQDTPDDWYSTKLRLQLQFNVKEN